MSLKLCVGEYMLSDHRGLGMRKNYFPRIVTQAFLKSTRDGTIERSPDPVTMIDGDLSWHNNTPDVQALTLQIHRAPRTIVAQSPSTVVIHDAFSFRTGVSPAANFPVIKQSRHGGRLQCDRASVARDEVKYARLFFDFDDSTSWHTLGEIPPGHTVHVRHLVAVQTPGIWTLPSEFDPRWEAHARWSRLRLWAAPRGSA